MIALFIGDGEDVPALLPLLFPAGLLIASGGVLLALDYGGSVEWMMKTFWDRKGFRLPIAEGHWQMRVIGGGCVVVGSAFGVGGVVVFVRLL